LGVELSAPSPRPPVVCSYDRPGYGWSDPIDAPIDAANVSRQLYALLRAGNENGPYVMVGHSLGGAYARMFAAEHREESAGLVLMDASNPSVLTTSVDVGLPPIRKGSFAALLASSDILAGLPARLRAGHLRYRLERFSSRSRTGDASLHPGETACQDCREGTRLGI
jgi:pimeloyl-ACP methyl ester carboxylesterase